MLSQFCTLRNFIFFVQAVNSVMLLFKLFVNFITYAPIPVAARSRAWVCGRSVAGIAGSNPAGGVDVFLLRVLCQVEVSATGRSLAQRSPNKCGVSECDREASTMR